MTAYKDLCIDVNDAEAAAAFWAPALGLSVQVRDDGSRLLTGTSPQDTIWLNVVPEPKTVKNRVHIDVNVTSIDALTEHGATVVDGTSFRWTLMADPEGGEFCAFVRTPEAATKPFYELVIDSAHPERIASWWQAQFGGTLEGDGDEVGLEGGDGPPWGLVFGTVPEPKTAKNRLHMDVWGSTGELVAAGAALLRAKDDEISWDVLADPEGNEFCVFSPSAG